MPNPIGYSRRSGGRHAALCLAAATAIIALLAGACGSEHDSDASTTDVGLTAGDFVGIWVSDAVDSTRVPPPSSYLIQFNADGTYAVALSEAALEISPVESGEWGLEGTTFTFNTTLSGCPGILERPGLYEVERLDDTTGAVRWTVVDDPCQGRISFFEDGSLSPQ